METAKRFMGIKECAAYLGLGISSTRKYMQEIGAVKKVGKRCLYDRKMIDNYFDHADKVEIEENK